MLFMHSRLRRAVASASTCLVATTIGVVWWTSSSAGALSIASSTVAPSTPVVHTSNYTCVEDLSKSFDT
jgi:hypothetical protein